MQFKTRCYSPRLPDVQLTAGNHNTDVLSGLLAVYGRRFEVRCYSSNWTEPAAAGDAGEEVSAFVADSIASVQQQSVSLQTRRWVERL